MVGIPLDNEYMIVDYALETTKRSFLYVYILSVV
nr:translational initiation factor 1 [Wikstroemia monnula]UZN42992.1 translational initiation factor 1 [Wikstroemia monnula]